MWQIVNTSTIIFYLIYHLHFCIHFECLTQLRNSRCSNESNLKNKTIVRSIKAKDVSVSFTEFTCVRCSHNSTEWWAEYRKTMHRSHSHECKLIERISHSQQSHLHSFWLFALLVSHKGTRIHLYWISLFKADLRILSLKNQSTTKQKRLSKKVQTLLHRRNTCHLYSSQVNFAISLHWLLSVGCRTTRLFRFTHKKSEIALMYSIIIVSILPRNRTDAYSEWKASKFNHRTQHEDILSCIHTKSLTSYRIAPHLASY